VATRYWTAYAAAIEQVRDRQAATDAAARTS